MRPQRLCQPDCDERREDLALIHLVAEREAADNGERYTLEEVAERAHIDLAEL